MVRMTGAAGAAGLPGLEGTRTAADVPGAAASPFYAAMQPRTSIRQVLARNVADASHLAEGCTRLKAGNSGLCVGTSVPAGTDMIMGLYSAGTDSIPVLCFTGQAPQARR